MPVDDIELEKCAATSANHMRAASLNIFTGCVFP